MATYTSAQATAGYPINTPMNNSSVVLFSSLALTTALANNDIVQMIPVPNGFRVMNVTIDIDALDSNASPTLTLSVGDPTTAGKYITVTAAQAKTGIVLSNNVTGATGNVYAIATSGGNPGTTMLQFKATANPATWVNGTVRMAVEIQQDSAIAAAAFS